MAGPSLVEDAPQSASISMADALVNLTTGMGSERDPTRANQFMFNDRISQFQADALYLNNWLGARVIDTIPDDATREWRDVKGLSSDESERFTEVEDTLMVRQLVNQAMKWARLYGGAGIIMGIDGAGEFHEPLDINRVKPGSLKFLSVIDRWHLVPMAFNFNNPFTPNWGKPEFYFAYHGPDRIHRSRILLFHGTELPYHLNIRNHFWGASVLEQVLEAIENATTAQNGVAKLITEAKVDVFQIPGLFDKLRTKQGTAEVMDRLRMGNMAKSLWNSLLMDAEENYEQKTGAITTGLDKVLTTMLEIVAGASSIPVTKLLGTSAPGMNSTGEEDTRTYYDGVKVMQRDRIDPVLGKLDPVLLRSELSIEGPEFSYLWNPLWQQTEVERSTVESTDAGRHEKYLDMGIIKESHIAKELIANETYHSLTQEDVTALERTELDYGEQPEPAFPELPPGGSGLPAPIPPGGGAQPGGDDPEAD